MAHLLILGADGMVGHMARIYLRERGHKVVAIARTPSPSWEAVDVEDTESLLEFIRKDQPEVVLNFTGILIQESEADPIRAIRLNSLTPRVLAKESAVQGFRFIHTSTDCVFSGVSGPYREQDFPDARQVYGRTKILGEVTTGTNLTIRTSKVGPEIKPNGNGLFSWFMGQKGAIKGFERAIWGGVTTLEMAKAIDYIIANPIYGLIHLTNGQPISKFDLLSLFQEVWSRTGVTIERDDQYLLDRSLISTRTDFHYLVPSYRDMMVELHRFMRSHAEIYTSYV